MSNLGLDKSSILESIHSFTLILHAVTCIRVRAVDTTTLAKQAEQVRLGQELLFDLLAQLTNQGPGFGYIKKTQNQ